MKQIKQYNKSTKQVNLTSSKNYLYRTKLLTGNNYYWASLATFVLSGSGSGRIVKFTIRYIPTAFGCQSITYVCSQRRLLDTGR